MQYFLLCLLLLAGMRKGYAYHPLAAEDASVIDPWHYEFEISHDFLEDADQNHSVVAAYVPKIGLPGNIEINFTIPVTYAHIYRKADEDGDYTKKASQGGFGDLELLGKFLMWDETERIPGSAIAGKVRFPNGNEQKGLGEGEMGYQFVYALTKSYKRFSCHLNAGWDFVIRDNDSLVLRAAGDYEIASGWHLVVEWDGQTDFSSQTNADASGILGGLVWDVNGVLTIDGGVRAGLTDGDDNFRITTALTFHL